MTKHIMLPDEFVQWQIEQRKNFIESALKDRGFFNFSVHTPVMATLNPKEGINLACKGTALIMKEEYMLDVTEKNEFLIKKFLKNGWPKSTKMRLERLLEFYSNPEMFDKSLLGTIELYGKKTLRNINKKSECALLFTDLAYEKKLISYQVNCAVEKEKYETIFYKYLNSLHDLFHKPSNRKSNKRCAYKFLVKEVYDKAPGENAGEKIA